MKTDLILNRLLSFTSLALAWITVNTSKFYIYGLDAYDRVWKLKNPGPSDYIQEWWKLSIDKFTIGFLLVAVLLDYFLWPYLFREESKEVMQICSAD